MENTSLLTIDGLKGEAISLRQSVASKGESISHAQALERVARLHGFRDWNTLSARVERRLDISKLTIGQAVKGQYLGQAFEGKLMSARLVGRTHMHVSIQLDHAVDVVTFSSFSSLRKRISGTINSEGVSPSKCSDKTPHLMMHSG